MWVFTMTSWISYVAPGYFWSVWNYYSLKHPGYQNTDPDANMAKSLKDTFNVYFLSFVISCEEQRHTITEGMEI